MQCALSQTQADTKMNNVYSGAIHETWSDMLWLFRVLVLENPR